MRPQLAPLLERRAQAGLFLDFDGTLSEIVAVAADARPVEGARELLERAAQKLAVVAVVSARSAGQLVEWLGPDVEIWGVHGAQRAISGSIVLSEAVRPFEAAMAEVRDEAAAAFRDRGLKGAEVEDKGVVITLHYRTARDPGAAGAAVAEIARDLAGRHDVTVSPGRMSIELGPPVELSKAAVVRDRAREAGLAAAMFVGDDTGDLPAFDALDDLAREGVATVRVAVRSDESPPELLERADVVVDGTAGVVRLLSELLR
ncbi:trehalose-phosphatase [soil metagenome]